MLTPRKLQSRPMRRKHEPSVPKSERPSAESRKAANMAALMVPSRVRGSYAGAVSGVPVEKDNAVRSEEYRRVVASLRCARCFVFGWSQAAHPPPSGKSIKEDDRGCFPLCCDRPDGTVGCHWLFDSYKLMPHDAAVEQAREWGRETRAKVINRGLWPKGLPMWEEETP